MTFCTITPTRGDRPEFLEFCKHQVSRMILKPDHHFIIDYPAKSDQKDLVDRVNNGVALAKQQGFNFAFIVEDDDYYPADYFNRVYDNRYDFIGDQVTTYYHIGNNGYETQTHHNRASLFTTGFKLNALDKFRWTPNKSVFLDIDLWQFAKRKKMKARSVDSGAIGIKHGMGVCGGIGHRQRYKSFDSTWEWLSERVDGEALSFYKDMHKKLV